MSVVRKHVLRKWRSRRALVALAVALATALPLGAIGVGAVTAAPSSATFALGAWELREDIQPQPVCGVAGYPKTLFRRQDCGFGRVTLTPAAAAKSVKVEFVNPDGTVVDTQNDDHARNRRGRVRDRSQGDLGGRHA